MFLTAGYVLIVTFLAVNILSDVIFLKKKMMFLSPGWQMGHILKVAPSF